MASDVPVLCVVALLACHGCHDGASPAANAGAASSKANTTAAASPTDASDTADVGSGLADAGTLFVSVDDDGKTFDIAVGSVVTFALGSHAGTGYIWIPMHIDANVLEQEGDRASERESDVPGAPKRDVYRFTAKATGTTSVEMSLKRPFGNAPAGRTQRVTFNVR